MTSSLKSEWPNEWADGRYAFSQNKGSISNPHKGVENRWKRMAWSQGYDEARMEFVKRLTAEA